MQPNIIDTDFHIHTSFVHGNNTPDEIAEYCSKLGLKKIAITEHVRKQLSYDFITLRTLIRQAAEKYNIQILTGTEAKILPDGQLDLPQTIVRNLDFIIGSVHFWPRDIDIHQAYKLLCESNCNIIGHVHYLDGELIENIISHRKILEINFKYKLSENQLKLAGNYSKLKICFGSDAHNISEIEKANRYFNNFILKYIHLSQIWTI